MRYFLENEGWKVEIDSHGAELKSVLCKANYREYMWYGNGKYWGRTSPVLFPFVGSVKDKQYSHQGISYPMGQHGFARDMEFTLVEEKEDTLWFSLASNEDTLKKYPFAFLLEIGYTLKDGLLKVLWRVKNTGKEEMYFSIGAHPAFLCPVQGEKNKVGYKLSFDGIDEVHHHGNTRDTGLALEEDLVLSLEDHKVTITEDFFDRCTYMIEGNPTGKVGLITPEGKKVVEVLFDTPLFAIWSPEEKNAPFICIEPWYGRCDGVNFAGELKDRAFTNTLEAGAVFEKEYGMQFYEV